MSRVRQATSSDAPVACFACSRPGTFGPFDGAYVCAACAMKIAGLAMRVPWFAWSSSGEPTANRTTGVDPKARADLADAYFEMGLYSDALREAASAHETLATFAEGVARTIATTDAETHKNLAIAYREMDLYQDSVREAGIAFAHGTAPEARRDAIGMILSAPLLVPTGLSRLRVRLGAN